MSIYLSIYTATPPCEAFGCNICASKQIEKFLKERSAEIKDDRVKMLN